mgnify:CR=1 FL=1
MKGDHLRIGKTTSLPEGAGFGDLRRGGGLARGGEGGGGGGLEWRAGYQIDSTAYARSAASSERSARGIGGPILARGDVKTDL